MSVTVAISTTNLTAIVGVNRLQGQMSNIHTKFTVAPVADTHTSTTKFHGVHVQAHGQSIYQER